MKCSFYSVTICKTILYIAFLFFIQITFTNCTSHPAKDAQQKVSKLEEKGYPNDQFFLQRMNPDGSFDFNAYEKGLHQIKGNLEERGDEPGFDLEWTTQGPANIGARINTVAVHPQNEDIMYIGFSHGGAWKTTDGGANWIPIFDEQIFPSIADIELDPNNPDIVYIGTGDQNIPHTAFIGDGIYKSEDAGMSWEHLGLTETRIISKIIIDPTDTEVIYVSTMGIPMLMNEQRGLYKTTDGGENWEQVLFISEQAGVIDMVMDPFDNQTIYASGWDRHRTNKISIVSGPAARIFKTTDGGENWTMLEGGLPNLSDGGRTGLAISQQTPGLVYSMFVGNGSDHGHQLYGIYRSEDGGNNWEQIPDDDLPGNTLGGFGWYFGKIRVHPEIDDMLFLLGVDLWQGINGTWERMTPQWWFYSVHADKHDLIFTHTQSILLGTDGGLYKTPDLGETWSDLENIPTTQFYRVAYNPHTPDLYYGGAQDNGTTGGNAGGITDWPRIFGGDGFQAVFHPTKPDVFYVETQRGNISVTDDGGNEWFGADDGINGDDDRNWDMPYMMSHHNSDRLIAGTDRIYISEAGTIPEFFPFSENLTEFDDTTTTRNHNISTLHESPIDENLVYAGTADGKVWRTDAVFDAEWNDISAGLPDRYVTEIKASPTNVDWVYVTHSGYKDNEFIPRVHASKDRGETWADISGDLPDLAVNDIYVLPGHQDSVLFIANDGGVYATINSGQNWQRLGTNMPIIPVYDLEWNVEHNEIFAGTFARSIMSYPLDSLLFGMPPDTSTSVDDLFISKLDLKIFPNPAADFVIIENENMEMNNNSELIIRDVKGRLIVQKQLYNTSKIEIAISDWISGTYYVEMRTENVVQSGKFIVLE